MDYYKDKDEHFVNQTDERIFFHLGGSYNQSLSFSSCGVQHTANSFPRPLR